jgi:abhydrolase domain-containing protein 11
MTFDDLALDLKHFIDITQLKDLVLLGHSYGGRNIFGYLQNYPDHAKERVKGVVIVDIVPTALNSLVPDLLEKLIKVNLNDRSYNDIKQELMTVAGDPAIGALVMSNIYSEVMINSNSQY